MSVPEELKTTKREDKFHVTEVDPEKICRSLGLKYDITDKIVFVNNIDKIAQFFDVKKYSLSKAIFAGGYWWAQSPGLRGGAGD